MENICQKSIEAAANIGQFYLRKNNGDYEKTADEIMRLCITDVSVAEDVVTVTTKRPGMLIGVRGKNVNALQDFLNQKIRIIEAEGSAVDYLIPSPAYEQDEPDWFEIDRLDNSMLSEIQKEHDGDYDYPEPPYYDNDPY